MKNPRSNKQKSRLEGLESGSGIYLVHQPAPHRTEITSDSVLRNTAGQRPIQHLTVTIQSFGYPLDALIQGEGERH